MDDVLKSRRNLEVGAMAWTQGSILLYFFDEFRPIFLFLLCDKTSFYGFYGTRILWLKWTKHIANLWEGIILFCHSGQFLALRFRPHFALQFLAFGLFNVYLVYQWYRMTGLDGPVLHGSTCGTQPGTLWDPVLRLSPAPCHSLAVSGHTSACFMMWAGTSN